jgi:hypothetical protein
VLSSALHVIGDAVMSRTVRRSVVFDGLARMYPFHLIARPARPRLSSLRVSQRWLREDDAAGARVPRD